MTYQSLKQPVKRILYTIRKRTNCNSKELCFGKLDNLRTVQGILTRLKHKGFLFQENEQLRGENNKVSVKALYWLTPEGIKVADEIVKEIDEYKRW